VAVSSIVITAVYILRVVGKILYGPVLDKHHEHLTDATWFERIAVVTLIVCIAGIGMYPSFISSLIHNSLSYMAAW